MEFRAGKMSLNGTRVVPDARKGLIRIGKVSVNRFLHHGAGKRFFQKYLCFSASLC